jgi:hypothetical protein
MTCVAAGKKHQCFMARLASKRYFKRTIIAPTWSVKGFLKEVKRTLDAENLTYRALRRLYSIL